MSLNTHLIQFFSALVELAMSNEFGQQKFRIKKKREKDRTKKKRGRAERRLLFTL